MSIRFDDKGKFFTEVISKETTPVIIQTPTHRIEGNIHIRPGQRLKDEINQSEPFFAVTDAVVYPNGGGEAYQSAFMVVYREYIIWLMPIDDLKPNNSETAEEGEA